MSAGFKIINKFDSGDKVSDYNSKVIAEGCVVSPIIARILVSRGIKTVEEARRFFSPTLKDCLLNPTEMKNLNEAASIILEYALTNQLITIYCDYDVDGLTSAAQLFLYLSQVGAKITTYIPNRFSEGYGLSLEGVERVAKSGTKLLVTLDCGIVSHQEILRARELGLKVIVIDHHQLADKCPAHVVVDPEQAGCGFKEHKLCTAGLTWYLLIVLRRLMLERVTTVDGRQFEPEDPKQFLDLATLGTICDMVPLTNINRVIAYRGLELLTKTTRHGLVALKLAMKLFPGARVSSSNVGFGLGPRINAAGRMGHAHDAFELLITKDAKRALELAKNLSGYNTARQGVEENAKKICNVEIEELAKSGECYAFALFNRDFHVGVIGIVAQKLVEQYNKPVAVMGISDTVIDGIKQSVIKGSVRGVDGFNVAEALRQLGNIILSGGGHEMAGGFSLQLDKLDEFKREFNKIAKSMLSAVDAVKKIKIDGELSFSEITFKLVDEITKLAPFGVGNPTPLFLTKDVQIDSVVSLSNNHLKVTFKEYKSLVGFAWNMGDNKEIKSGATVSIIYTPEISTRNGVDSIVLSIRQVILDITEDIRK